MDHWDEVDREYASIGGDPAAAYVKREGIRKTITWLVRRAEQEAQEAKEQVRRMKKDLRNFIDFVVKNPPAIQAVSVSPRMLEHFYRLDGNFDRLAEKHECGPFYHFDGRLYMAVGGDHMLRYNLPRGFDFLSAETTGILMALALIAATKVVRLTPTTPIPDIYDLLRDEIELRDRLRNENIDDQRSTLARLAAIDSEWGYKEMVE